MYEFKQVIVMRTDLNMRKGKMVAQGSHASVAAVLPNLNNPYVQEWLEKSFAKICVGIPSLEGLQEVYDNVIENYKDIPCSYIEDNGTTEFKGVKTPTCIAVGPGPSNVIDEITGHLKLL